MDGRPERGHYVFHNLTKESIHFTYNVTYSHVRANISAVEKQYYIF